MGLGPEEARGWLGAWTPVCPDKPLATVLALVNFKSRFNRRQNRMTKTQRQLQTIKPKLKSQTWDGPLCSLHHRDSPQLSSTQTDGRILHIFSFVGWLEDKGGLGAQGMSTKATPVPHHGVRWGQGCGWGSQTMTSCDFLNSLNFLVSMICSPSPFLEAASQSVAQT